MRRLTWLPPILACLGTVAAFFLAPTVDATQTADRLLPFFGAAAAVMVALFVGLGQIQRSPSPRSGRALRFLHAPTFASLLVGTVAAIFGAIPSLPDWTYRYLFAITIGGALYGLVSAFLAFSATIAGQISAAKAQRARTIRGDRSSDEV